MSRMALFLFCLSDSSLVALAPGLVGHAEPLQHSVGGCDGTRFSIGWRSFDIPRGQLVRKGDNKRQDLINTTLTRARMCVCDSPQYPEGLGKT